MDEEEQRIQTKVKTQKQLQIYLQQQRELGIVNEKNVKVKAYAFN